jgi:hypothetical protein
MEDEEIKEIFREVKVFILEAWDFLEKARDQSVTRERVDEFLRKFNERAKRLEKFAKWQD